MKKTFLFLIFFFVIPISQAISINSYRLTPKGIVYEGTTLILSVNVTSDTNVTKVYATLSSYTLEFKEVGYKNLNLSLKIGTNKNGLWFYSLKENEGYYILENITAVDINNTLVTVEPFLEFMVINKTITSQNISCSLNFSLGEQEFNSSQTVNYSIRIKNFGSNLTNINYSLSSQLQTYPKSLGLTSLPSFEELEIKFDFITPNLTEDKLYSFVLNVTSKECNFTFPFNIKVKKIEVQKNQTQKQGEIKFPTLPIGNIQFPEIRIGNWKISSELFPVFIVLLIIAIVFFVIAIRDFFRLDVEA
ncbi:MAG: hypothetical protein QW412_01335 [Candidatus Aenigmatarchaeota archaeon]